MFVVLVSEAVKKYVQNAHVADATTIAKTESRNAIKVAAYSYLWRGVFVFTAISNVLI